MSLESDVSWVELGVDRRPMSPEVYDHRVMVVHAISEDGLVIATEWYESGKREGLPEPEG